jgi:hypothetical protein
MNSQHTSMNLNCCPPELQKQVVDFVCFLRTQQQQQTLKKERLANIKADSIDLT